MTKQVLSRTNIFFILIGFVYGVTTKWAYILWRTWELWLSRWGWTSSDASMTNTLVSEVFYNLSLCGMSVDAKKKFLHLKR